MTFSHKDKVSNKQCLMCRGNECDDLLTARHTDGESESSKLQW